MAENNAMVRVFDPHAEAKAVIKDLQKEGFASDRLSVVGKDYQTGERIVGYDNTPDRMKVWLDLGHFWGGLSALLMGSAYYFIPDIGRVMVFGPLASRIVRVVECSVIPSDLSALGAGLRSIGIPQHLIVEYERALKFDKFLVIAHEMPDGKAKTGNILQAPSATQTIPSLASRPRQRKRLVARH